MAYYLKKINPVPSLLEYSGPHKVGTVDVEIPVSDLKAPSAAPPNATGIHTIQYRIFYPADPDSKGKRITWLPAPQRNHVSAYTKFLGLGPLLAEVVSFIPRHLHYTTIPVHKNANLLEPNTSNKRWPTMIFSHGLGGNRNAYSHIAGSLASHGVVVICPEHRDGSAAVSFIRDPALQDRFFRRNQRHVVPYIKISHESTPETWYARNQQLKIRLWELGLIHEAIMNLDEGLETNNMNASTPAASLAQFASKLNVQDPGSIIYGGHSFGATTMVQLLKSTYYAGTPELKDLEEPLFEPALDCRLRAQITSKNPTILLDMWSFPLIASPTSALYNVPLPVYADVPDAPGGSALIAVESDNFYKWTEHLHTTARILSPDPSAPVVTAAAFERPISGVRLPEPNVFYVIDSVHLSQSDFGVLFPWITKKVFGAEEPERALRLNMRAILQMLRVNGVPVARTWVGDLVDGSHVGKLGVDSEAGDSGVDDGIQDDKAILDRSGNDAVDYWKWIDIVGLGEKSSAGGKGGEPDRVQGESQMEGEIEAMSAVTPAQVVASVAA